VSRSCFTFPRTEANLMARPPDLDEVHMLTSMPRPALSMKVIPLRLRMTLVVLCRSHLMRSRSSDASSPPTMRPLTSTIVTSCSTRTVAVRSCLALDGAELSVRPPAAFRRNSSGSPGSVCQQVGSPGINPGIRIARFLPGSIWSAETRAASPSA